MPVIQGGQVIEGVVDETGGHGPYYGTAAAGTATLAGTVVPGGLYIDTVGGTIYINKGTALATPSWVAQ